MGSLSHDLEHGNGRVSDYWLGSDGKVHYRYRSYGDTTPDSDKFNYGHIYTTECLENPDSALLCRLKGEINPEIANFDIEIAHTTKEWGRYWIQRFSYAEPEEKANEGNGCLIDFLKVKVEQGLVTDTDSEVFKALIFT